VFSINRSDYLLHSPAVPCGKVVENESASMQPRIKQVEFNSIAASFMALSQQVSSLHRSRAVAAGAPLHIDFFLQLLGGSLSRACCCLCTAPRAASKLLHRRIHRRFSCNCSQTVIPLPPPPSPPLPLPPTPPPSTSRLLCSVFLPSRLHAHHPSLFDRYQRQRATPPSAADLCVLQVSHPNFTAIDCLLMFTIADIPRTGASSR
jgi:hypothetical protein